MTPSAIRHRTTEVRRHYSQLITALQAEGDKAAANRCAELAVAQGVWRHPLQRPPHYFPELEPKAVYRPEDFWFTAYLQANYARIRAELDTVTDPENQGFLPVEEPLLGTGRWEQVVLYEGGHRFEDACDRFPVIAGVVDGIPEAAHSGPGVVTLSWLYPGTHIVPHCGGTNARLRVHLGLRTPAGPRIRVGTEILHWAEGECIVFDDSFEHEVWHEGTEPRVVLLLDVTHPDLGDTTREWILSERTRFTDRVVDYMKERGISRVDMAGENVRLTPQHGMSIMIRRYLREIGARCVELRDGNLFHNVE